MGPSEAEEMKDALLATLGIEDDAKFNIFFVFLNTVTLFTTKLKNLKSYYAGINFIHNHPPRT